MAKTVKTKKPTGLGIKRSGMKITCTWKCGDKDYVQGQEFEFWDAAAAKWRSKTVTATARSCSVTFTGSNYRPESGGKTWDKVGFRVRGRRSIYDVPEKVEVRRQNPVTGKMETQTVTQSVPVFPTMSDWETTWLNFGVPDVPKASLTPNSTTNGQITLSWSLKTDSEDTKPFHSIEWQARLIKGKNDADFSKIAWSSGNDGWQTGTDTRASGSITINQDTQTLSSGAWTRAVRVRARGRDGNSGWSAVAYYRYAKPFQATITAAKAVEENRGMTCSVSWNPNKTWAHPVTDYQVQYLIAVPVAGASTFIPPISDWTDVGEPVKDSSGKAALAFRINDQVEPDEAIWFRVVSRYGLQTNSTESPAQRVYCEKLRGLESAGALDVSYNSQTKSLTLAVNNPSEFPRTSVHIRAKGSNNSGVSDKVLASDITIPGSGTKTQVLDLNSYLSVKFECWVQSSYKDAPKSPTVTKTFYPVRESTPPWAFPPHGLNLSKGSTAGSVDLTWTLRPSNSEQVDVSYSTDPDAWDTAGEPYTVVTASSLTATTVTGLDYGNTYYFAVKATGDNGATRWSDREHIYLSQSDIPKPTSLAIAEETNTSLKVTWNWVSWADSIEISWADNENAWASSSEPASAVVSKSGAKGTFYIKELERGKRWYVRARYINGDNMGGYVQRNHMMDVIPVAPEDVMLEKTNVPGTVRLSWTWSWDDAEEAEVTWSDDPGAWDSTEGPSSQTVDKGRTFIDIANLETDRIWYARIEFIYGEFSSISGIESIDLRTNPVVHAVRLSDETISSSGRTDISWEYSNEDGTEQRSASVFLVTVSGDTVTKGRQVASVDGSSAAAAIYAADAGLAGGSDYWLAVQAVSVTGFTSELSAPVKVTVVSVPVAEITETSLVEKTIIIGEGSEAEEVTVTALTEMPLTLSATGAGVSGSITAYIERAESYFLDRPDKRRQRGYEGEIIAIATGTGDFSFDLEDLKGTLDDGANYRLAVVVKDRIGQTDEASIDFMVVWDHQAIMPEAEIDVDEENMIVKITPVEPEGAEAGDYCDIYRLSADRPELILAGAEFGETYVDPYPAFGVPAGHRVVFRTVHGDFITEDGQLAMADYMSSNTDDGRGAWLDSEHVVINWDNHQLELNHNIDLSSSWEKDFILTKYLGGSVQGDWNPAVSRTGSISAVAITLTDQFMLEDMRRLAVWDGVCHVRTPDGSSYPANVQVSEDRGHDNWRVVPQFSLDITRVDYDSLEGMTLAEWEAGREDESE